VLWFVQFLRPSLHDWVAGAYALWASYVLIAYLARREMRAPVLFWRILREPPARVPRP
jgi:hypothetical protein